MIIHRRIAEVILNITNTSEGGINIGLTSGMKANVGLLSELKQCLIFNGLINYKALLEAYQSDFLYQNAALTLRTQ